MEEDFTSAEIIHLPHTYNAEDAFDDEPGYYRGKAYYRKVLITQDLMMGHHHYLKFGAVNQSARIFINGVKAGNHRGGYTSFIIDVTEHLTFEVDTLVIEVDNSHDLMVPPLRGDFTFYGGIYRDVELISVPPSHFTPGPYGDYGIYIDPLKIDSSSANILVRGEISQVIPSSKVTVTLYNNDERIQVQETSNFSSEGSWSIPVQVTNPELWNPENPHLYTVTCKLNNADGSIEDQINLDYGFRYYSFDPDKGFFINGEPLKLIGVNRHQDRPGKGNALTTDDHIEDLELIKKSGFNFLRTAHYPQDASVIQYCDRNGLLVSMEIPLDHDITVNNEFNKVCREMVLEMIHQYYNHPSIIIWAYMNEMGLGKRIDRDSSMLSSIALLADDLELLIRKEDPYRYTMIPNHGHFEIYKKYGLTEIPMIVGWNLYYGWYEPSFNGFSAFIDHAHREVPDKPIIITEYGAGADPRIISFTPERFDFSQDWALEFHQSHIDQILDRPFIAGSAVWNMFDFGSESRQDAVPHINNKGLMTYDRQSKSSHQLYTSLLSEHPILELEKTPPYVLLNRGEKKEIPVTVVTNYDEIIVKCNGKEERIRTNDQTTDIKIPVKNHDNLFVINDLNTVEIAGYDHERFWKEHSILSINFGSSFYFNSEDGLTWWIPDAEVPLSFLEVIGGNRFQPRDRGVGSDRGVKLTPDDPVYQTALEGVAQIELDVLPGGYEVVLYLARISEVHKEQLVKVNDVPLRFNAQELNMAFTLNHSLHTAEKIVIDFTSVTGKTYINGIQIIRK